MVRWADGRHAVSVESGEQGRAADLHSEVFERGSGSATYVMGQPEGDRVRGLAFGPTVVYVGRAPGVEPHALRESAGADAVVDVSDPYWLVALPAGRAGVVRLSATLEVDLAAVPLRRPHQPDLRGLDDGDPDGWTSSP